MNTSQPALDSVYRHNFSYTFRPHLLGEDPCFNVVCPLPVSDGYQTVERLTVRGDGVPSQTRKDARGNVLWSGQIENGQEAGFRATLYVRPFRLGQTRFELPGPTDADRQSATMVPITDAITDLAQQLTSSLTTDEERARALFHHVRETIQYQYPPAGRGAETTLQNGSGDCGEYANLLCALCRAIDIPARPVMGWICAPWFNGPHAWAELWLEAYGWIPVDANLARESRYWGPMLGVPSHPDFYFGNLDSYRLVLSRGTALHWPFSVETRLDKLEPQLNIVIDGQSMQFWRELLNDSIPYLQLPYTIVEKPKQGKQLKLNRLFSVQSKPCEITMPPSFTAFSALFLQPRYILSLIGIGLFSALLTPILQSTASSNQLWISFTLILSLISDIGTLILLTATLIGFAMKRGPKDYIIRGATVLLIGWVIYSVVLPRWISVT